MDKINPLKAFLDRLIESNVRPREAQILYHLSDGPSFLGEVGSRVNAHKSNLSRLSTRLKDQGYITMTPDKEDPRKRVIELSEEGGRVTKELFNP